MFRFQRFSTQLVERDLRTRFIANVKSDAFLWKQINPKSPIFVLAIHLFLNKFVPHTIKWLVKIQLIINS